jgi:hypothetical protein
MPVAVPVAELIVAIAVLLLLQVPPVTASLKEPEEPAQKDDVPVMATGGICTVTVVVAAVPQPFE